MEVEFTKLADTSGTMRFITSNTNSSYGAIVINMKRNIDNDSADEIALQTLNDYRSVRNIKPNI